MNPWDIIGWLLVWWIFGGLACIAIVFVMAGFITTFLYGKKAMKARIKRWRQR